ncbi:hypothetical protein PHAVU_004G008927 [Phaseolus vulgaris]|uniref:Uncharacterized protein n=1 Tax=Phaseolus vulgaris TaxID=3885 RepID=V7D2D3_PHAVU|nr:hypothetical protein PHAVU_L009500g [Phaseolus vulgaris]ESW35863.1 hypothetical protein PHAVU_L009500g [Phaseolus vulgaris]
MCKATHPSISVPNPHKAFFTSTNRSRHLLSSCFCKTLSEDLLVSNIFHVMAETCALSTTSLTQHTQFKLLLRMQLTL